MLANEHYKQIQPYGKVYLYFSEALYGHMNIIYIFEGKNPQSSCMCSDETTKSYFR